MKFFRPQLACRRCAWALLVVFPILALAQTPGTTIPVINVAPPPPTARLLNLSIRSTLAANESLIAGFVISGPTPTTVLVRAAGPALTPLGVAGAMTNPRLQVVDSIGRVVAQDDDWSPQGSVELASLIVGAFPLRASSRDAATVVSLAPGAYTLIISGNASADAGVVLGEIYHVPILESTPSEVRSGNLTPRLVNLSVRGRVSGGTGTIGGFIVSGSSSKRFLIRVAGPALATFGVAGALVDPTLELAGTNGTIIQTNDNWDSDAAAADAIREATSAVGTFPFQAGSRDSAVVARLSEGAYTVIAHGVNLSTGAALIEIYELDN